MSCALVAMERVAAFQDGTSSVEGLEVQLNEVLQGMFTPATSEGGSASQERGRRSTTPSYEGPIAPRLRLPSGASR